MPTQFNQNQSRLVGIDIRSSAVQLLEFGDDDGRILIKQGTFEPLLKSASHRKVKRAAVAMSGTVVMSKQLTIERGLSESEIERVVWTEAKKNLRDLLEACYLDFQCLGPSMIDPQRLNLHLVACRKDPVDRLMETLAAANISTEVVDVDYYALQRAAKLLSLKDPTGTLGIVNLDSVSSTLVVIRGEDLIYTCSRWQNNAILLAKAKRHLGVQDWLKGYAEKATDHLGLRIDLAKLMAPSINAQVHQLLQFYYSSGYDQLDQIILCGECAIIPELAESVQEQQQPPVIVGNPFVNVNFGSEVNAELLVAVGPAFMLCSGLALWKRLNDFN